MNTMYSTKVVTVGESYISSHLMMAAECIEVTV